MDELKLTGNCLKGSRPILSFDTVTSLDFITSHRAMYRTLSLCQVFDQIPHYSLLKELFTQVYVITIILLHHVTTHHLVLSHVGV